MSWGLGYGSQAWGGCIPGGPDMTPPTISLESPANGSGLIPFDAPISFRLSDDLSGVDLGSIRVTTQQGSQPPVVAFQNGLFSGAFSGPESFLSANASNGFDFILDPTFEWAASAVVKVTVTATDAQCNAFTATWSFTIAPRYGCVS
jgi:hypothetical protein